MIASRHEIIGRGHAERLIPMIAEILTEARVDRADEIWVDVGPGSFTGVRVGIAAGHGLGLAWRSPVRGFRSDALIARRSFASGAPSPLAVILDALRGEVFFSEWRDGTGADPRPLAPPDAAACAHAIGAVVGNGVQLLPGTPAWSQTRGPAASDATYLQSRDLRSADPLYIRAADAKPGQ